MPGDAGREPSIVRAPPRALLGFFAGLTLLVALSGCAEAGTRAGVSARDSNPTRIVALGDSITRAYGLCQGWGDCPEASWATGSDRQVGSHVARLTADGARPLVRNLALSGATVAGLGDQARQAVAARADYVTVLIGGNDACAYSEEAMTSPRRFAESFSQAIDTLTGGLPDARILVLSIPDLHRLWEVGKDDEQAVATWNRMGICRAMLANPTSTAAEDRRRRARVRARISAYNEVMAALCSRHDRCRWDGNAVFEHRFGLDAVSPRDYWHPSVEGQRRLAEVSWKAGFFG